MAEDRDQKGNSGIGVKVGLNFKKNRDGGEKGTRDV